MNKSLISLLVIFAMVSFPSIPPIFSKEIETIGKTITYHQRGEQDIKGYMVKPKMEGEYPGLILIHEWWGLNEDIKEKARKFAQKGYVILAVDLYQGESTTDPKKARELAGAVRKNMSEGFENLKGAIKRLKKEPWVTDDRLGSIGWCFGGGWSYQIAKNNLGVKASVIYYGRFNPKDDLKKMRAEIIGHFAENDMGIKVDKVNEFKAMLKTIKGRHEVYIYPNTSHGFASRPGSNPVYDKKAADLALERTLKFLKKNL